MHFSSRPLLGVIIPEMHSPPLIIWCKIRGKMRPRHQAVENTMARPGSSLPFVIRSQRPLLTRPTMGSQQQQHKQDDLLSWQLCYWHFLTRGAVLSLLAAKKTLMLLRIWVLGVLEMHQKWLLEMVMMGVGRWLVGAQSNSCKQY